MEGGREVGKEKGREGGSKEERGDKVELTIGSIVLYCTYIWFFFFLFTPSMETGVYRLVVLTCLDLCK